MRMLVRRFGVINQPDREPAAAVAGKITDSDVLESIAPAARYKAKRILDYLKRDGNVHFKDSGEVVFKNETIRDSNIVDLLDSVIGEGKKGVEKPSGFTEFASLLKDIRAPESLVNNSDLQKLINPAPTQKPRKSRAIAASSSLEKRRGRKSSSLSPTFHQGPRPKRTSKKPPKLFDYLTKSWENY